MWDQINIVFDHLPLAAVIDDCVFCAHGGIPCSVGRQDPVFLADIDQIPCPFDPSLSANALNHQWIIQNVVALLASTPVLNSEQNGEKRRTEQMAFGKKEVERFMKANGLSFIIRSHESIQEGVSLRMDDTLLTINSHSMVCFALFIYS